MKTEIAGVITVAHLKAILPGLKTHVSKDEFRTVLDNVHLYETQNDRGIFLVFEATDGHRAIKYLVPAVKGNGNAQRVSYFFKYAELELLVKQAKVRNAVEVTLENDSASQFTFPELSRVIPHYEKTPRETDGVHGYNAGYMSDAFDAAKAVARLAGKVDCVSFLPASDNKAPCLIEASGDGVSVLAVVMPCRL